MLRARGLNVYDVLRHDKLLLTKAAVEAIEARLGRAGEEGEVVNVHDVIRKPLVTEKSNIGREEENLVTLAVDPRANKHEIKRAVESSST